MQNGDRGSRAVLGARERLVFALDFPTLEGARGAAATVAPAVGVLKVGLELFTREGPKAVGLGEELGLDVFLDLKLHDIPQTVQGAVVSAAALGARYLTVHASGGAAMLERAANVAARMAVLGKKPLTVLAVTVLTSLDAGDLKAMGVGEEPSDHVLRLARMAWGAGIRGFVTSPAEVAAMRRELGPEAVLVTPGVRPAGAEAGDQKRVATPARAIAEGADLLVVGRPIRDARDPLEAARSIASEIEEALRGEATPADGAG
jgi:orotidine-5'-phosphate decarboxylase